MNKVFIIAEAGVNHNGSLNLQKAYLCLQVENSGVDAVKFQTFKAENLVSKMHKKQIIKNKQQKKESQIDMIKN